MSYKDKIISLNKALSLVKNDDIIIFGMAGGEPQDFAANVHKVADRVKNVTITNCLPNIDGEYFVNPDYAKNNIFKIDSWFFSGSLRKTHKFGNVSYIPNNLHFAGSKYLSHKHPNIYVGSATYPDKHGFISLSLSNVYEKEVIDKADIVILEINKNFPRTFGTVEIHYTDVDYLVESNYMPPIIPDTIPNEKDYIIGRNIAKYINDGDTIQLGIGGIPNAVAESLMDKKDLGIHTEMFTTGLMKLAKSGAANGSKKTQHKGKHVCAFAMGSQEVYDYLDDNPSVLVLEGSYVNDPYVMSRNDNQISINAAIEIDLTGQVCSESIGTRHWSGTGGQTDTAVGAQNSKNGKSFIALYSTANVKNPETGEREEVSKIVSTLKPGAGVTLSRNDVDRVVTEYGVAELRGTNIDERVERLIAIAHPDFREQLRKEAIELGIIAG